MGPTANDLLPHPAGFTIKFKAAVVISHEGRLSLKASQLTDVKVCSNFIDTLLAFFNRAYVVQFDPMTDAAQNLIRWFYGGKASQI